jgi:hypothetical protein
MTITADEDECEQARRAASRACALAPLEILIALARTTTEGKP